MTKKETKGFLYKTIKQSGDNDQIYRCFAEFEFKDLCKYITEGKIIVPECQNDVDEKKVKKFQKILDKDPNYFSFDIEPILLVFSEDCNDVLQAVNGQHRLKAITEYYEEKNINGKIIVTIRECKNMKQMEKLFYKIHSDSTKIPFPKKEIIEKHNMNIFKEFKKLLNLKYKKYISKTKSEILYTADEIMKKITKSNSNFSPKEYSFKDLHEFEQSFLDINYKCYDKYYKDKEYESTNEIYLNILENKLVFLLKSNNSFDNFRNEKIKFEDPLIKLKDENKEKKKNKKEKSLVSKE